MRFKKVIQAHVEEQTVHSRTECDFCGGDTKPVGPWADDEVVIAATLGEVYPGSDNREVSWFDCCKTCWTEKVMPALKVMAKSGPSERCADEFSESYPLDPKA